MHLSIMFDESVHLFCCLFAESHGWPSWAGSHALFLLQFFRKLSGLIQIVESFLYCADEFLHLSCCLFAAWQWICEQWHEYSVIEFFRKLSGLIQIVESFLYCADEFLHLFCCLFAAW